MANPDACPECGETFADTMNPNYMRWCNRCQRWFPEVLTGGPAVDDSQRNNFLSAQEMALTPPDVSDEGQTGRQDDPDALQAHSGINVLEASLIARVNKLEKLCEEMIGSFYAVRAFNSAEHFKWALNDLKQSPAWEGEE